MKLRVSILLFFFGFAFAQADRPHTYESQGTDQVEITAINLDQPYSCIWCAEGVTRDPGRGCDGNDNVVAVSVETSRPLKQSESIRYEVTGGEVEVDDERTTWTLPEQAGTYEITASVVSDGLNVSSLSTTIVNIYAECGDDYECPTIEIRSPVSEAKAGVEVELEALIVGGDQRKLKIEWNVEGVVIVGGRGEKYLRLKIPEDFVEKELVVSLSVTIDQRPCDSRTFETIRIVEN